MRRWPGSTLTSESVSCLEHSPLKILPNRSSRCIEGLLETEEEQSTKQKGDHAKLVERFRSWSVLRIRHCGDWSSKDQYGSTRFKNFNRPRSNQCTSARLPWDRTAQHIYSKRLMRKHRNSP